MAQKLFLMMLLLLQNMTGDFDMKYETVVKTNCIAIGLFEGIRNALNKSLVTDWEYKLVLSELNIILSKEIQGLLITDYNELT